MDFQGNLNDLISRLTRGIGITNEKLDLILQRKFRKIKNKEKFKSYKKIKLYFSGIEDVEARIDTSPPGLIERQVRKSIKIKVTPRTCR